MQEKNTQEMPIIYNADSIDFAEGLVNHNAIQSGYTYPLSGLALTHDNFLKFMSTINEKYNITEYDFSESQRKVQKQYKADEFIIYVSGTNKMLYLTVGCKTLKCSEDIFNIYKKYHLSDNNDVTISMTSFFHVGPHISSSEKLLDKEEINAISTLYYPYIDTDVMFQQFFTLQENILILTGKPGIGKSKMASAILKYAADNEEFLPHDKVKSYDSDVQYVSVAYVKSPKLLSDDNFWRELEIGSYDFVIMDDLDYFLTKRSAEVASNEDQDKNQFLNQFLSYTDGIEKNKTKFIITTNQPYEDLDLALLRKGRLFDILELRSLNNEEALNIWKDNALDEENFREAFQYNNDILPADLGSEISKRLNTNKLSTEVYLLEDDISKIQKAKRIKKVGV